MNEQVNLKEIVHPKMDILFLALNPPVCSNSNGHYFSNNLSFWNLLYDAGLITQRVNSKITGDEEVFRSNSINFNKSVFGITDLCHDVIETNSNKVKVEAKRVERIVDMLRQFDVRTLCFLHAHVAKAFEHLPTIDRRNKYGIVGNIESTTVYEMPFHCASIPEKHLQYQKLIETLK